MGKLVTVKSGYTGVVLIPNQSGGPGLYSGQTFTLTDAEYAGLPASVTRAIALTTSGLPDPVRGAAPPSTGLAPSGDSSGALDTAAIQALLTATGKVSLQAGTFYINATLTVTSNTILQGAGEASTIIQQTNANLDCLKGTDLFSVVIRDIRLLGPGVSHGTGTGNGINFTVTSNPANVYLTMENLRVENFGVDGIAIATPIISTFSKVISIKNGRHGLHFYGSGGSDGTSCSLNACFMGGNYGAAYYFHQMAYSSLNGCAADANGTAYQYETCIGITENGCGSEEPYDFSAQQAGYVGYSRWINNSKVVINSPYSVGNIGIAFNILNNSHVVISDMYEGSPGNTDSVTNNPTSSLTLDSSATVQLLGFTTVSTPIAYGVGLITHALPREPATLTLVVSGTTYTPNCDTADQALIAAPAANFTVANPIGSPNDGQKLLLRITSGGTGRTPTWGTAYASSGVATLPVAALPASKTVTLGFIYNASAAKWVLIAADTTGY